LIHAPDINSAKGSFAGLPFLDIADDKGPATFHPPPRVKPSIRGQDTGIWHGERLGNVPLGDPETLAAFPDSWLELDVAGHSVPFA